METIPVENCIPHLTNASIDPETGESLEYLQLIKSNKYIPIWTRSFDNELGRLAQGILGNQVESTNTTFFIGRNKVPAGLKVTYGRIVEQERTCLTVGGNLLDYPGDCSTQTASEGAFIWVRSNSVVRGTEFLRFGLTIRHN
jgi:hypothetical protein